MAKLENERNSQESESRKTKLNIGGSQIEVSVNPDGSIDVPQELQMLMAAGQSVIQQAAQNAQSSGSQSNGNAAPQPLTDGNVADSFRGLPMSELIGAPLIAAAEAQQRLAGISWDFYEKIAFDENKNTRTLKFELNRPVVQDGVVGQSEKMTVEVPFIGIVPVPALLTERVDVDFQMEVTDTNVSKSTNTEEANASASSKWFGCTVSVGGKVSSSRENTRTTNQTAKYQVHVTAAQQSPTEGMSKLMDIVASCIEPIPQNS